MDLSGNSTALWQLFIPNLTTYNIPPEIVEKIGGGPGGGATVKSPEKSWDSNDLAVYFTRIPSLTARTPTRAVPTSTSPAKAGALTGGRRIGTIIGAALGGLLFLALLLIFCLCILKKIKKKRGEKEAIRPPGELDGTSEPTEIYTSSSNVVPKYQQSPTYESPGSQAYFHSTGAQQFHSPQQQHSQIYEMGDASGNHTSPRHQSGQGRSYSAGAGQERNYSAGAGQERSYSTGSGGGVPSPRSAGPVSPPSAGTGGVFSMGPYYPAAQEPAEHPALRSQRSEKGLGGRMGVR